MKCKDGTGRGLVASIGLSAVAALLASIPLEAGPPFVTDDPEPVD